MTRWIRAHLLVATLLAVLCFVLGARGEALPQDDKETGICQRKYIRNSPENLELLRGCKVIEGSLQIAAVRFSPNNWTHYSFPDLREITGYFLLFDNSNLTNLRYLFPNLAVIRGQELVDNYALIISTGNDLKEIGLPSLTNIQQGSVWIFDNSQLCYVDTIDWSSITHYNESSKEGIGKNKPMKQCPNICPDKNCPTSGRSNLCWSNQDCQKVFSHSCPECHGNPCTSVGDKVECCSDQCLGGCRKPRNPRECFVCKHFLHNGGCQDHCPSGFYEYLQRRCVTRDDCNKINATADISKTKPNSPRFLTGKIYDKDGKKMCVLECPKDTEVANGTTCVPCNGTCKKNCPSTVVDSIERARELSGCTRITGGLKISIRRSSAVTTGTIVKQLKENLDKIEEIDDYLVITHTYAIVSLDFLENLRLIRGRKLEDNRYAVVVRSNENLVELWDSRPNRRIIIEDKNASVLFHYNPKLCPAKIWDLVTQSGINRTIDNKFEIGITNGDKVTCNTKILEVEIEKKTNNSVLIRFENFRRNLTLTSHLLNYEIHYKEAPNYPVKNVSKYDDRDPCRDDDWTILEYPKMKDSDVKGGIDKEPQWEHSRLIVNLKHFAWYALYVKTVVIPDENDLNNSTGAESNVIYFQTLPGVPSKPRAFTLTPGGPNSIEVTWTPPAEPNGELEKFYIWLKPEGEDVKVHDQRDFCEYKRAVPKVTSAVAGKSTIATSPFPPLDGETTTISVKSESSDCCSCSDPTYAKAPTSTSFEDIHYQENVMMNHILSHVFIMNPTPPNRSPDVESNSIKLRKRRAIELIKRSVGDSSDNSGEKIGENVFPGPEKSPGTDPPRIPSGLKNIKEVKYEGVQKYTFTLKDLSHYTTYVVGIQACRKMERNDQNSTESVTRTCSDIVTARELTAASPTADDIDATSISINVTEDRTIKLTWAVPQNPNGVIMGYTMRVQRWEGVKNVLTREQCVTRKKFEEDKYNYTFRDDLIVPGNYTVRIQVASLGSDSEWTEAKYFLIEDTDAGAGLHWALIMLIPLLMLITAGTFLGYYYMRKKDDSQIFSPNPEYMANVEIPDEWEVPRDKLQILQKVLGQGSFGKVMEGILRDFVPGYPAINCAVKTVSDETPGEYRLLFLREAALMVKLDCRCHHVVKLLGVISKTQPTYVIMELMTKGDLKNYLRSRRRENNPGIPPPTLRQALRMAAEIADGMIYLHKHKLVHRDLAARNCMVSEDLVVKVGDFGMTKEVIQSDYYRKQTKGLLPVRWMAPESLRDGVFTSQSDVWSFGVVLWEMATLAYQPYQGLSNDQVLEYVLSGRTMERPVNCPDILFEFMTMCWQTDPRHRPNFMQLLDRLMPDLDPSFAQVSFYHTAEGQAFREEVENRVDDHFIGVIDVLTPLATYDDDDDLDDYDSDEEGHDLDHHIVDDLGDTPSRLLLSSPPTSATITGSSKNLLLTNGLALNPLVIHSAPRNDLSANTESVNLANHALPAPTTSLTSPYSVSRNSGSGSNYSPRPRTNSNNNNTNPRLPVSLNIQNMNRGGVGGGSAATTGSSSSISSTSNFTSTIPNGIDSLMSIPFHQPTAGTTGSSPKCSLTNIPGDSIKDEQSKANALNSGSSDNSQSLMINFSGEGNQNRSKISNGNSDGNNGGNGYIIRRVSPRNENQAVNRTTQC